MNTAQPTRSTFVSAVAWVFEGAHGLPFESLVVSAIVIANALLGYFEAAKAEQAVAALQRMAEVSASVWPVAAHHRLPAAGIVPVDIMILSAGAFLLFRLLEEWMPRTAASLGAVLYVFVSAYRDAFWSRLQPETVTEPLIFLALYLAAKAARNGRPGRAFAAGALIGAAVAFKVTMAFVIFPAGLTLRGARREDLIRVRAAARVLPVSLVVMTSIRPSSMLIEAMIARFGWNRSTATEISACVPGQRLALRSGPSRYGRAAGRSTTCADRAATRSERHAMRKAAVAAGPREDFLLCESILRFPLMASPSTAEGTVTARPTGPRSCKSSDFFPVIARQRPMQDLRAPRPGKREEDENHAIGDAREITASPSALRRRRSRTRPAPPPIREASSPTRGRGPGWPRDFDGCETKR